MNHQKLNMILSLFLCVCLLVVFTPTAKANDISVMTQELLASGKVSPETAARVNSYTALYQVKEGDTLWDIAYKYGGDWELISAMNFLQDYIIKPGQILVLPVEREVVYTVQGGDTLSQIARSFGVSLTEMIQANSPINPNVIAVGQDLIIPGHQHATPVSNTRLRTVQTANRGSLTTFTWPVTGTISSCFGPRNGGFHHGLDIAARRGTPVKASRPGQVEFVGWLGAYGRTVILNHGDGWKTLYAHNSELLVREGQLVSAGHTISLVGDTGNSTGDHLHFEVIKDGERFDPLRYLKR